ncbi:MAG TPA: SPOR domain-containing protein [Caldimonas sp.]|jgi:DedD protein
MFKQKRDSAPDKPRIEPADAVRQARTRARQRLIGAIVLLVIGIIGFPLVFETQPRPIPVDVPIEIPRRDALPPLTMPPPRSTATRPAAMASDAAATTDAATTTPAAAARTAPATARGGDGAVTESSGDSAHDTSGSRAIAHASSPAETPRRAASAAVVAIAPASAATRSADGERARALLEGHPASAAEEQRFVVQVGAFADAEAARETRKNVEKLGFKTYTQVAQTSAGNRIRVRVGPFTTRGEAEAALAKAKAAGISAVLLTL